MTVAKQAFENWKSKQTFFREETLEAATYYEDGHGNVIAWHEQLGVLKTIPLPQDEVLEGRT